MLPEDLITPKEVARLLRCSVSTIYRMLLAGRLRGYNRGTSRYLISCADVQAVLEPMEVAEREEAPSMRSARADHKEACERLKKMGLKW